MCPPRMICGVKGRRWEGRGRGVGAMYAVCSMEMVRQEECVACGDRGGHVWLTVGLPVAWLRTSFLHRSPYSGFCIPRRAGF